MKAETRYDEWQGFERLVAEHINKYANAQYGDKGTDQATNFTPEDIQKNLQRYMNRIGKNMRGMEEAKRDCLKIGHYACMLWWKYQETPDVGKIEEVVALAA